MGIAMRKLEARAVVPGGDGEDVVLILGDPRAKRSRDGDPAAF